MISVASFSNFFSSRYKRDSNIVTGKKNILSHARISVTMNQILFKSMIFGRPAPGNVDRPHLKTVNAHIRRVCKQPQNIFKKCENV